MSEPRKSRREPKLSQRFKDFIGEETLGKSTPAKAAKSAPKATPAKDFVKPTPKKAVVKPTPKAAVAKATPKTAGRGRPKKVVQPVDEQESEEDEDIEESEEEAVAKATPKTAVKGRTKKVVQPVFEEESDEDETEKPVVKVTSKTAVKGRPKKAVQPVDEEESDEDADETEKSVAKLTPKIAGRGRPKKIVQPVDEEEEYDEDEEVTDEEEELQKPIKSALKASSLKTLAKKSAVKTVSEGKLKPTPKSTIKAKVAKTAIRKAIPDPMLDEDDEEDDDFDEEEEDQDEIKPAAKKTVMKTVKKQPAEVNVPVATPEVAGRTKRVIKVTAKVAEAQESSALFKATYDSAKKVVAATKVTMPTALQKIKRLDVSNKGKGGLPVNVKIAVKAKPVDNDDDDEEDMDEEHAEDDEETTAEEIEEAMEVDEEELLRKSDKTKAAAPKAVTPAKSLISKKSDLPEQVPSNNTETTIPDENMMGADAGDVDKVQTEADSSTDSPVKPADDDKKPSVKRVITTAALMAPSAKKIKLAASSPVAVKAAALAVCSNEKSKADVNNIGTQPIKTVDSNSTPIKTAIVKSSPIKTATVKNSPMKSSPIKSAPVKSAPLKSNPIKSAPTKSSPVKINAGINRFEPYGRAMTPETKKVVSKVFNKKKGIADELASRIGSIKDSSDDMSDTADENVPSKSAAGKLLLQSKAKLVKPMAKSAARKALVPKPSQAGSGSDSDARRSRRQPKITEKMKEFMHKSSDEEDVDEPSAMMNSEPEDEDQDDDDEQEEEEDDELTESDDDGGESFLNLMKGTAAAPPRAGATKLPQGAIVKASMAGKGATAIISKAKAPAAPVVKTRPISQVIKTKPIVARQVIKAGSPAGKNVLLSSSASKISGKSSAPLKLANSNVKVNTKVVTTKHLNGTASQPPKKKTLSSMKEKPIVISISTRDPAEVERKKKLLEEKDKEIGERKVIKIFTKLNINKKWDSMDESVDDEDMDSEDFTDSDEEDDIPADFASKKTNGQDNNDWKTKNADITKLCEATVATIRNKSKAFVPFEHHRNVLTKVKFMKFLSLCEKLAATMTKVIKDEARKFSSAAHLEEYCQDLLDMIAVKADPTKDDCLSVGDTSLLTAWVSENIVNKSMPSEHMMVVSQMLELLSTNADIQARQQPVAAPTEEDELDDEDEDMEDEEDMLDEDEEEEEDMDDEMDEMEDEGEDMEGMEEEDEDVDDEGDEIEKS